MIIIIFFAILFAILETFVNLLVFFLLIYRFFCFRILILFILVCFLLNVIVIYIFFDVVAEICMLCK